MIEFVLGVLYVAAAHATAYFQVEERCDAVEWPYDMSFWKQMGISVSSTFWPLYWAVRLAPVQYLLPPPPPTGEGM